MSARYFLDLLCLSMVSVIPQAMGQNVAAGPVGGPALGFVYDAPAMKLRSLLGIPGASFMGAPLDLGVDLSKAWISPLQDFALAAISNQPSLAIVRLGRDPLKLIPIDGLDPAPDLVALSPRGSSAIFYYAAANRFQIVSGLPDSVSLQASIDASQLPAKPTVLAIADDAASILAGVKSDGGGAVYLIAAGSVSQAYAGGAIAALAFAPNSQNAVLADSTNNRIYAVANAVTSPLAGPSDGISSPIALVWNGARIFVANSGMPSVTILAGAQSVTVPCTCAPSGLYPLSGQSVFRLTELSDEPISVLDGNRPDPRIVLIPAESGRTVR